MALRLLRDTWQPGTANNVPNAVLDNDSDAEDPDKSNATSNPDEGSNLFEQ